MPDRVQALMNAVQPARPHPLRHRLTTQAEARQLVQRNHPMLPPGEIGDHGIQRANRTFVNHWLTNVPVDLVRGRHARTVPQRGAPVGYERDETATTP